MPLARLPVAVAALPYMRAIHIFLVMASPAIIIIYRIWRSIVNVLVDGIIKGAYINKCRTYHRICTCVVGTVATDAVITACERDSVRVASVACCALVSSIMIYAWVARPAYCSVKGLEGLYIVLAVMAQTAGYGLAEGV
jgi:ATP/ADP translocase